ncbi:hypothetical protein [Prauserella sp. PE36]|uniref:hypothetical protein n=1 Tax=Prauserella sp. PE36 TaxID=1504709 RepID=UPI0011BE99F2|nr:hypothetical protein [Prauserella sp. PE36]
MGESDERAQRRRLLLYLGAAVVGMYFAGAGAGFLFDDANPWVDPAISCAVVGGGTGAVLAWFSRRA